MISLTDTGSRPAVRVRGALLAALALLSAIAPFSTDLYLSAFPIMTRELGTTPTGVQLTLTAFLVGVAIGQIVLGPLSDRIGRKPPLLGSAIVLVIASAVTVFAPDITVLIVARLVQGAAGAAGMVLSRAIIADLSKGAAAARAMSLMMLIGGFAPVAAPLLGSLLLDPLGWRGVLGVVLALTVAILLVVIFVVPETHTPTPRLDGPRPWVRMFGDRVYVGWAATFAFSFATLMAYISASPFVYQEVIGLDTIPYGLSFAANSVGLAAMGALSARIVTRVGPQRIAFTGVLLLFGAGAATLVIALVPAIPDILLMVSMFVVVSSVGLVMGNASALAIGAVPLATGAASAVMGMVQFILGAVVSPLVSLDGGQSAVPVGIVMTSSAAVAVLACLAAGGVRSRSRG